MGLEGADQRFVVGVNHDLDSVVSTTKCAPRSWRPKVLYLLSVAVNFGKKKAWGARIVMIALL